MYYCLLFQGANSYGQLSLGSTSEQCICPSEVTANGVDEIVTTSAGGRHSLLLDSTGAVFGSGCNDNGQLAGLENNTVIFTKLEDLCEFNIAQITCGWESSFAITTDGLLVAWGSNKFGQLGVPKEKVRIFFFSFFNW